eukprot:4391535-Pyramimonas_sp.AAC.1
MKRLMERMLEVETDMCARGLREPGGPNHMKKHTRLLVSSARLSHCLGKRCPGNHDHVTIEGKSNGVSRSKWAGRYTTDFCDAILRGTDDIEQFWAARVDAPL